MPLERPFEASDPYITVVVPSLPGHDRSVLVDALAAQTVDAFEAVFVVDETVGVCEARNAGIEAAAGEVLAFTDDDCAPPPEWLAVIAAAFREAPELVGLEGPIGGLGNYEGTRKYPTANLAVRRSAAEAVGGFRTEYEYWREDTEFGWRIEEEGRCRYEPDLYMDHPSQPRATIIDENERRLKREYPEKYEAVIVPDTLLGRVNDWLWRRGFWDAVDRVRYRGR